MSTAAMLIVMAIAVAVVLAGTAHAWSDWHRFPERYGYTPGERAKRRRWLTRPTRGTTRQPINNWFAKVRLRR
jgi:hypothetical protein